MSDEQFVADLAEKGTDAVLQAALEGGDPSVALAEQVVAGGALWCAVDLEAAGGLRRAAVRTSRAGGEELEQRLALPAHDLMRSTANRPSRVVVDRLPPGARGWLVAGAIPGDGGAVEGVLAAALRETPGEEERRAIGRLARRLGAVLSLSPQPGGHPSAAALVDFAGAFEHAPEALLCTDASGQVIMANAAAATLTGFTRSQLLGMHADNLVPERYRHRVRTGRQAIRDGATFEGPAGPFQLSALRRDGSEVPIELMSSMHMTGRGSIGVNVIRDLSSERAPRAVVTDGIQRLLDDGE